MLGYLKIIEKFFKLGALQEEFRKIGGNFITAGVVGVFINHFVGTKFSTMFWASIWINWWGLVLLFIGIMQRNKS